jgi:dTDP-4-dehydrorhamnose reductase
MLVLAASRPEVSVVTDQICTPSYVPHVARGILALLEAGATGTFHVTNGGWTSWHGLASELFKQAGLSTAVRQITSRDYPSAVERPRYSVLATEKLVKTANIRLSDWQEGVADYLRSR